MVPIHTRPPSREYDEGWEAIFGKKKKEEEHAHEVGSCSYCDKREREVMTELTRMSQEFGGYDSLPDEDSELDDK